MSLKLTNKYFFYIAISLIIGIIILDQYSKYYIVSILKARGFISINITSFLDIVYLWNHGSSFGFLSKYYQYSNYVFLIINSLIVLFLYKLFLYTSIKLELIGFSMILGGAIGNIIDRLHYGAVFDFISFYYKNINFPVFNFADFFITLGIFLYLISSFYQDKLLKK